MAGENELQDVEEVEEEEQVTGEVPPGAEGETEEPETDEQEAAPEAEAEAEAEAEEEVDETPEPDSEIEKLRAEIRADFEKQLKKTERRQMYLQRQIEKLEKKGALPEIPETDAKAPKEEDFDSYEEYEKAQSEYRVQLAVNKELRKYREQTATQCDEATIKEFIDETIENGREKYEDFDTVARESTLPINNEMLSIMQGLDNPADIAYYLGKNRKECAAISNMSREQAIRALTKVEAKVAQALQAGPADKPDDKKPKKKVTKAPPPIKPSKPTAAVSKDPRKMSQAEYEAWRMEQMGGGG